MVIVDPFSGREEHLTFTCALLHDGSHKHLVAPHVFICQRRILLTGVLSVEVERTGKRTTEGRVLVGKRVVVGEPLIAHLDESLQNLLASRIMVRLRLLLGMSAHHGSERAHLHPTHVKFLVAWMLRIYGKAAEVRTHVAESGESGVEHKVYLWLKTTP